MSKCFIKVFRLFFWKDITGRPVGTDSLWGLWDASGGGTALGGVSTLSSGGVGVYISNFVAVELREEKALDWL